MPAQVNTISPAFQKQRTDMQLCKNLMSGQQAMLAAGQRYIPVMSGEDPESYALRLSRATLFNAYKRTVRYLCGRVFEEPVTLGEDATDQRFIDFTENVDRLGHNLTIWSRHAFESGLNAGVTFCLVDFTNVNTRVENGVRQYQRPDGTWADKTEAADRDNKWGPYFIHIPADQVLDARLEWQEGNPRITHFRYIETLEEPDGLWGTTSYQQIRAFYLDDAGRVIYEVWSNRKDNGGTGQYIQRDVGTLSINVIPVTAFMPGEKVSDLTAQPALIDLAYLNKSHWCASADHEKLMVSIRCPGFLGKCLGAPDPETGKTKIVFGPDRLCLSTDEKADIRSICVDPSSFQSSRQDLKDIEDRMSIYGLQLLQPKTGAITATESIQDSAENNSTLKAWALQFQDFLENCFALVGLWWKLPDGPSVVVNTDFANAVDADFLLNMYRAGVISGETFLAQVKSLGLLPDDLVVEDEIIKVANGLMANNTGAASLADIMKQQGL